MAVCVPSKFTTTLFNYPWISGRLKRLARRKKEPSGKLNTPDPWGTTRDTRFKYLKKQMQWVSPILRQLCCWHDKWWGVDERRHQPYLSYLKPRCTKARFFINGRPLMFHPFSRSVISTSQRTVVPFHRHLQCLQNPWTCCAQPD